MFHLQGGQTLPRQVIREKICLFWRKTALFSTRAMHTKTPSNTMRRKKKKPSKMKRAITYLNTKTMGKRNKTLATMIRQLKLIM